MEQVGAGLEKIVVGSLRRVPHVEAPLLAWAAGSRVGGCRTDASFGFCRQRFARRGSRCGMEASDVESGASLSCRAESLCQSESGEDRVCDSAGLIGQENEMNCGNPHVRL